MTNAEITQMSTQDLWDEYESLSETIVEAGAESHRKVVIDCKAKREKVLAELIKRGETK